MLLITMILEYFVKFYLMIVVSVSGHEISHYVAARVLRFSNVFLCIGFENICGIRTKYFFLSPLAFTGFVEYEESFQQEPLVYQGFIFYFSGVLFNIILMTVAFFMHSYMLMFINVIIVTVSLLPFRFVQSDLCHFYQLYKKGKRESL